MNVIEQLRLWGTTHAAARAAEQAARGNTTQPSLASEARRLREHANRLHGEIYSSLGSRAPGEAKSR